MCIGVKLAFIYIAVACGVGVGHPLRARASELGGGDIIGVVQSADDRMVTGMLHGCL